MPSNEEKKEETSSIKIFNTASPETEQWEGSVPECSVPLIKFSEVILKSGIVVGIEDLGR